MIIQLLKPFDNGLGLTLKSKTELIGPTVPAQENACIIFWEVIKLTDLKGDFQLKVKKELLGESGKTGAVKILSIKNGGQVTIKCRLPLGKCFLCELTNLNAEDATQTGSGLRQKLWEVTKDYWFDPNKPNETRERKVRPVERLLSVEPYITAATAPAPQTKKKATVSPVQGLTKNMDVQEGLFKKMARASKDGPLTNEIISDLILEKIYGPDFRTNKEVNRKRSGPVLGCWTERGLLEKLGRKGTVSTFKITAKAIETFQLQIEGVGSAEATPVPESVTPPPAPTAEITTLPAMTATSELLQETPSQPSITPEEEPPQPQEPLRVEATPVSSVLTAASQIKDLAKKMVEAQKSINELRVHKAVIELEIDRLQTFLKSPECQEIERMKTLFEDLFTNQPAP